MAKSALSARVLPEALRSIAFGAIGAAYAPIGTALSHPSRLVTISNGTDVPVLISWDGATDNSWIAAGSNLVLDICTNRGTFASEFAIAQHTRFWVKQSGAVAPAQGAVYLSSYYAEEHLI